MHDAPDPEIARLRQMSAEEKLRVSETLRHQAWAAAAGWLGELAGCQE